MKLPTNERVFLTGLYAGVWSNHVCVVPDATDEEILAVCNANEPSVYGKKYRWTRVIRTEEDAKAIGVSWKDAKPGTCLECPPRIHMVVR